METKIPFGVSRTSNRMLDVFEVKRGKACDCICPSCHSSLIARQGEMNIWHFAHDPDAEQKSETACEYAFWTSIHLMSMQILAELTELETPACTRYMLQEKIVFPPAKIIPDSIVPKTEIRKVSCDAVLTQSGIEIGIVLRMPHRSDYYSRTPFSEWNDDRKGILEIDFSDLESKLFEGRDISSFKTILIERIVHGRAHKNWKIHPREIRIFLERSQRLTESPQKPKTRKNVIFDGLMPVENNIRSVSRLHCQECQYVWSSVGNHQCPGCHKRNFLKMY